MSVHKDPNTNTWFYQFKIKDNITGNIRTYKKRGFKLKKEALAAEAEAKKNTSTNILTFKYVLEKQLLHSTCDTDLKKRKKDCIYRHFDYIDYELKNN